MNVFVNLKKFLLGNIFSIICFFVILYLSLAKFENTSDLPKIPYLDKIVHIIMYAGFCFTILLDKARRIPLLKIKKAVKSKLGYFGVTSLWYAILLSTMIGIAMEFAQYYFTTYRGFETEDIMADFIGSIIGAYIGSYVMVYLMKLYNRIFVRNKNI